jgi:hypothetical protein
LPWGWMTMWGHPYTNSHEAECTNLPRCALAVLGNHVFRKALQGDRDITLP